MLETNLVIRRSTARARTEILSVPEIPTVIFCGTDLIAIGAMNALQQAGTRVPKDISVVGIDNLRFAFLARPPLTTVNVPREELGCLLSMRSIRCCSSNATKGLNTP
jgi:DNA-binding LacI/PurR family transcriptional regulator